MVSQSIVGENVVPIPLMKEILAQLITLRPRRSVFLWGPPGIGKSSIVYQVGQRINYKVFELRLGYHDPVDLRGIPVPVIMMNDGREIYLSNSTTVDQKDVFAGVTKWFIPNFLAFHDEPIILFLDEMNQADRAVQKVAQQLILDHKLGDYELPPNVVVVAAGNREVDRTFVQRMAAPTLNRFIHFECSVDPDGWIDWAVMNNIHPMCIAYIKFKPNSLFAFDAKGNDRSFPTPRTWEFVSDVMKHNMTVGLFQTIEGAVGRGEAVGFQAFMDIFKEIPDINEIFRDPMGVIVPSNPSVRFSLCILLARKATYKNLKAIKQYVERFGREYCAYTVKYTSDLHEELKEVPEFVEWAMQYSELLVDERIIKNGKKKTKK